MKINKLIALTTAVTMLISVGGGYNLNEVYASESTSTISIENQGNIMSSYMGTGSYEDNKYYSVKGDTSETWSGWFNRSGDTYTKETDEKSFNSIAGNNKTLIPASTYNVSVNPNGGTINNSSAVINDTYTNVEGKSYPTPIRAHYTLLSWLDQNNNAVTDPLTLPKGTTGNKTYRANWEQTKYPITYNLNGGGGLSNDYYTYFAAKTLGTPSRTDYKFTGWTGSNGSTPQTTVTIPAGSEGGKSYTANWADADDVVWLTSVLYNNNTVEYNTSYPYYYRIETYRDQACTSLIGTYYLANAATENTITQQYDGYRETRHVRRDIKCKKGGAFKVYLRQCSNMKVCVGYYNYGPYSGSGYLVKIPSNAQGQATVQVTDTKKKAGTGSLINDLDELSIFAPSSSEFTKGWMGDVNSTMMTTF